MMMSQQLPKDQQEMELNGNGRRTQSPAPDHAPSPAKRPRLDSAASAPQAVNLGGNQSGVPGTNGSAIPPGMNQRSVSQSQFPTFISSRLPGKPGSMPMPNTRIGSMPPDGVPEDGQSQWPSGMPNQMVTEYQKELKLLEEQNQRRLILGYGMQENNANINGPPPTPGASPRYVPPHLAGRAMDPSANGDALKRGTPKMPPNALPGSPSITAEPSAHTRASPAAMNYGRPLPPEMANPAFLHMRNQMMNQGGARMAHPGMMMNGQQSQMAAAAMNRMPGAPGPWQQPGPLGQHMMLPPHMQGQSTLQPPPVPQQHGQPGTPGAVPHPRTSMPPPQIPPSAGNRAPSPSSGNPTTLQPAPRAAPKGKKGREPSKVSYMTILSTNTLLIVAINFTDAHLTAWWEERWCCR